MLTAASTGPRYELLSRYDRVLNILAVAEPGQPADQRQHDH